MSLITLFGIIMSMMFLSPVSAEGIASQIKRLILTEIMKFLNESFEHSYLVNMTIRAVSPDGGELWSLEIDEEAEVGQATHLQLSGNNIFAELQLFPYYATDERIKLFLNGRLWLRHGEQNISHRTINQNITVPLNEPVLFIPFGIRDHAGFRQRMRRFIQRQDWEDHDDYDDDEEDWEEQDDYDDDWEDHDDDDWEDHDDDEDWEEHDHPILPPPPVMELQFIIERKITETND